MAYCMYVRKSDQRRAHLANGLTLCSVGLFLLGWAYLNRNNQSDPNFQFWAPIIGVSSFAWGAGLFAKFRGYSGLWGLISLPLLLVPGLLLIATFPDKWNPNREEWMEEGNHYLVDGQLYRYEYEINDALLHSVKVKYLMAAIFGLAYPILLRFGGGLSDYSRDNFEVMAGLSLLPALTLLVLGSCSLAKLKNFHPSVAVSGLVTVPFAGLALYLGSTTPEFALQISVLGILAGTSFLLLTPRRQSRIKKSPFRTAPQSAYMANPETQMYTNS